MIMRLLRYSLKSILFGLLCLSVLIFILIVIYGRQLPDYRYLSFYYPSVASRIFSDDGALLSVYSWENRIFAPLDEIPELVRDAFIVTEDKHFWKHPGVDIKGVARAMVTNIFFSLSRNQRRPHGGSTITQQVARTFLLNNELSVKRKIKEAILAFRIERALSKERILELYLNEIYLGFGCYGVATASLQYFERPLSELSLAQIAYLAALPKAPNNYHPLLYPSRAISRRNWVLSRMAEEKIITKQEAALASKEPLSVVGTEDLEIPAASYFSEEVRRKLITRYGVDTLYKGGLTVYTSLDRSLQEISDNVLKETLISYDRRHGYRGAIARIEDLDNWTSSLLQIEAPKGLSSHRHLAVVLEISKTRALVGLLGGRYGMLRLKDSLWARKVLEDNKLGAKPKTMGEIVNIGDVILVEGVDGELFKLYQLPQINGAIVVLDPHSGRILAMSGGFSWEMSQFNRVTQAKRQPGSAFKPIVYLAALENGFTPSSVILDAPLVIDQGNDLGVWKPTNYSGRFYGPTTLRVGLEESRNVTTARLASLIGMNTISNYAQELGVIENMPRQLSMSLGAGETTLLNLTNAFASFVNGGKKVVPNLIDRIQDKQGRTVYRRDDRVCRRCMVDWQEGILPPYPSDQREQLISSEAAYQIVSMLEGVVKRGTGRIIKSLNIPLAGKTGTTSNSRDAWFIGFSADLCVGIYVGYDVPTTLGLGESGPSLAAPAFRSFMAAALKGKESVPFRIPKGIKLVKVNRKDGSSSYSSNSRDVILEAFRQAQLEEREKSFQRQESVDFHENLGLY